MEDYTINEASVTKTAFKWGLIVGVVLIFYSLIINMSGQFGNQGLSLVNYVFVIVGIVMAHRDFKSSGDGYMTFGQGLGIGTLVSLIGAIVSGIFGYIYMSFIDTGLVDMVKDKQLEEYESQGMTAEQIDQATQFTDSLMTPMGMTIMAVIFVTFIGFILSLIISAFTKNSNPDLEI